MRINMMPMHIHEALPFGRESPVRNIQPASNGNKTSQSTQPYLNTCPFQLTKVRDLDPLQNDENKVYCLQIPMVANQGILIEVKLHYNHAELGTSGIFSFFQ